MARRHRLIAACLVAGAAWAAPAASAVPWRDRLGLAGAPLPSVGGPAPLALLDTPVDLGHPVFAGARITAWNALAPYDLHGTGTASLAAGTGASGVLGAWPGMAVTSYAFPAEGLTCDQSAYLIDRAVADGAKVISMSYGGDASCFSEQAAVQRATRRGVLLVAAAGNGREYGNPREYPSAFAHVLTVAALAQDDAPAGFSSAGPAIDLAAPGTDIPIAVPPAFDPDGSPDGVAVESGTSFAAPMVAALAAALRRMRPGLTPDQVTTLLCRSARDVPPTGWDRRTGCGIPDLVAAATMRAPRADVAEPNDDIVWVDGLGLGVRAGAIGRGSVRASVTAHEDPADVYRVRVPARSRLRVTLRPLAGGADLRVLDVRAQDLGDRAALLGRAARRGKRRDTFALTARTRGARIVYVAVEHDARAAVRAVPYTLTIATARS